MRLGQWFHKKHPFRLALCGHQAAEAGAVCTFLADAAAHGSHYPGEYAEAALTACGTFVFSIVVSCTPSARR